MSMFARARSIGIALAALVFAIDQWTKHFIIDTLGLTQIGDNYPLLPFFDFTRTNNYGVSLGLFSADSMEMRWVLVAVTALIACVGCCARSCSATSSRSA